MNFRRNTLKSVLIPVIALLFLLLIFACKTVQVQPAATRNTAVTISGNQFHINGEPTYKGRIWTTSYGGEYPVEGLLMNARLVQGIFDDLNPDTRGQWAYPDTRKWDPDRNTREFTDAMASWREHGLLSFSLNLQGGCPYGYCPYQVWDNSFFFPDGSLREEYLNRLEIILDRADELGMVVILGYFYFGQDGVRGIRRLDDEQAVIRAVDNITGWLLDKGYRNLLIEINNECSGNRYEHPILDCSRVHELIERVGNTEKDGYSFHVTTSLSGGMVPTPAIVEVSDYILLHGNGVRDPERMSEVINEVREMAEYNNNPIVNNEDDQPWRIDTQGWGEEGNNFVACVKNYASWGYFDFRQPDEHIEYNTGFQSVPVNWQITSERKRDFFDLLAEITGSPGTPGIDLDIARDIGKVSIQIQGGNSNINIEQIDLVINNQVISSVSESPYEFHIDNIPDGEHWVKARATYRNGDREIIIESPYYRNPWWPYGGPPR
jgi:hypothetical protein